MLFGLPTAANSISGVWILTKVTPDRLRVGRVKRFFSIPDGNLAYRVWAAGLADSLWKAFDAAPVEVTAVANQELYSN
jgi:hypothetical protein